MAQVIFDEDVASGLVRKITAHTENVATFNRMGADSIRECGVTGGAQGKKLNDLADLIEEKTKEAVTANEEMNSAVRVVLENTMSFNYQNLVNKAAQSAESIGKATEIQANKKDFD